VALAAEPSVVVGSWVAFAVEPPVAVLVVLVVMAEPAEVLTVSGAVWLVIPEMVSGYGLVVRSQAGLRL